ncbi:MAG: hypothetical protein DMG58_17685 [Acidobacteria bacterium]|nr:MAG: hypothetical protein DMG58_17685 [Acidobacteriota bacterium]
MGLENTVPEPSSVVLLAIVAVGVVLLSRRRFATPTWREKGGISRLS